MVDVVLPTTNFGGGGTAGWTANDRGNTWTFKDKTWSANSGIVKVGRDLRCQVETAVAIDDQICVVG